MKELKEQTSYIDDFDVNVRHYLTLGEIDEIAMEVAKLGTFLEREQMICYKVLCYCTDIGEDVIAELDPDEIIKSSLWDNVESEIYNFYAIHDAIKFYESPVRLLSDIAKMIPGLEESLKNIDAAKVIKDVIS